MVLVSCGDKPAAGAALPVADYGSGLLTGCEDAWATCPEVHGKQPAPAIRMAEQPDRTWAYQGEVCFGPAARGAQPQLTAAMVRARAVRLLPRAAVGLAPHTNTLVNIQTIMWAGTARQRTLPAVTLLGRRVVVTVTAASTAWTFGDGATGTSAGPGTPYAPTTKPCRAIQCPGYYGHTYRHTGTMTVTAQIDWTATFTVDGSAPITIPGPVTGPAATARLTVKQARSVIVANPES